VRGGRVGQRRRHSSASPLERLPAILTRHADREDLAHVAGLGLGLAIVDDVMRTLDGQVWVSSVEGEGTTFTLRLPVRAGAALT
jgi:signal transduction histidine kinase